VRNGAAISITFKGLPWSSNKFLNGEEDTIGTAPAAAPADRFCPAPADRFCPAPADRFCPAAAIRIKTSNAHATQMDVEMDVEMIIAN
jgi:hypothetical protein